MAEVTSKWYADWFDTPFYHILYQDRNYQEAGMFMHNLINYLDLEKGSKLLDLACGKGRHSVYLHQMGFDVLGTDLSQNSISKAKKHERKHLRFSVNDMTEPLNEQFDAVFNLFTSFGYFKEEKNNQKTIDAIAQNLVKGGYAVIDFMNVKKVKQNLVPENDKKVNGIHFHLKRWTEKGFIFKQIDFSFEGKEHRYIERVKCLSLLDFKRYFRQAGLHHLATFGNYHLDGFDSENSDRLILIVQK